MEKVLAVLMAIILIVLAFIFVPLAIIWALNTLFAFNIVYSFWTWLSVVVLNTFVFNGWRFSKKDK